MKTELPQFGATCTVCGKLRFTTRRAAKQGIRQMRSHGRSDGHLNAYRCGDFWHIGHLPSVVIDGSRGRDDIWRPR